MWWSSRRARRAQARRHPGRRRGSGGELQSVVVGIGINLTGAAYPPDVEARAVAIEANWDGRRRSRGVLVACSPRWRRRRALPIPMAGQRCSTRGVRWSPSEGRARPMAAAGAGLRGDHGRRRRHRCAARADARRRGAARRRRRGVGVNASMPAGEFCREIETYLCRENGGHLVRIVGPVFQKVAALACGQGVPIAIVKQGIDRTLARDRAKPAGPVAPADACRVLRGRRAGRLRRGGAPSASAWPAPATSRARRRQPPMLRQRRPRRVPAAGRPWRRTSIARCSG